MVTSSAAVGRASLFQFRASLQLRLSPPPSQKTVEGVRRSSNRSTARREAGRSPLRSFRPVPLRYFPSHAHGCRSRMPSPLLVVFWGVQATFKRDLEVVDCRRVGAELVSPPQTRFWDSVSRAHCFFRETTHISREKAHYRL